VTGPTSQGYDRPEQGNNVSFIAWIVLGLIAGFIASRIVNRSGYGLSLLLGVVGAVAGGYLYQTFGKAGVTGVNIHSLLVAVAGAAICLIIYHLFFGAAGQGSD
jgi:uncharacterized membrane protein YeaQ/YmgE (transglycosylase-associated protein family)